MTTVYDNPIQFRVRVKVGVGQLFYVGIDLYEKKEKANTSSY